MSNDCLIPVFPFQISEPMAESGSYILVLDAPTEGKQVPVLIGENEAQAIIMASEGRRAKRPLTHHLLNNIMEAYMLSLKQAVVDKFEEGIFYTTLTLSDGFGEKQIDSRTSDAVVLALLQDAPVFITPDVLSETCMEPGALTDNLPSPENHEARLKAHLDDLEDQLRQCEADEDYERAAQIQAQIERIRGKQEEH